MVKNPPAHAGDITVASSVPESGRSPGEGHGSPLQYSCLENPTDRGAWQATVPGVTRIEHDQATKPPPPPQPTESSVIWAGLTSPGSFFYAPYLSPCQFSVFTLCDLGPTYHHWRLHLPIQKFSFVASLKLSPLPEYRA